MNKSLSTIIKDKARKDLGLTIKEANVFAIEMVEEIVQAIKDHHVVVKNRFCLFTKQKTVTVPKGENKGLKYTYNKPYIRVSRSAKSD